MQAGITQYSGDFKLGPRETQAINIRKLRDAQKADFQGNKIPAGATDGCVRWVRIGSNAPVMGRVVVINARQGMASNYNCTGCCGPSWVFPPLEVTPASATILVGETQNYKATGTFMDCNGFVYTVSLVADWSSSNTLVATVSAGSLSGTTVTGTGDGTAGITAVVRDCLSWTTDPTIGTCDCTGGFSTESQTSSVNVQKPFFLQAVSSTNDTSVCLGLGCETDIVYRVRDNHGNFINRAGMTVAESVTVTSDTCGASPVTGTANTDAFGQVADRVVMCCAAGATCGTTVNQTATVNGCPVQFMSMNGLVVGRRNVITFSCTSGQGSCPRIEISP